MTNVNSETSTVVDGLAWNCQEPATATTGPKLVAYNHAVSYTIEMSGPDWALTVGRLVNGLYLPIQTTRFPSLESAKSAAQSHSAGGCSRLEELVWPDTDDDDELIARSHIVTYLLREYIDSAVIVRLGAPSLANILGEEHTQHSSLEDALSYVRESYDNIRRCLGVYPDA